MSFPFVVVVLSISIHALVKRATLTVCVTVLSQTIISIHALVKRATCDGKIISHSWFISIHALVKRATSLQIVE